MKLLPELPLLRRELTELANRKRTYVIRFVGALIILFYVFVIYEQAMAARLNSRMQPGINPMLGVGGAIFSQITPVLFIIIEVLMPALCCAAIAQEKESNTIGTLLLTKLSPGTIVLEKFLSRIIPMLTLLLLSFPVLAHVFSLGGVDTTLLLGTIWLLLCECILLGSLALLCSAWFPTTIGAFTGAYVVTALMLILIFPLKLQTWIPSGIWYAFFLDAGNTGGSATIERLLSSFTVPQVVLQLAMIFERTIPAMLIASTFLVLTRVLLVRRAFASQSSFLLKMFGVIDRFFQWLNERTTGGIELVKDTSDYPTNDPIAWRERSKKSLGKARYLFRILVALQVPTLFICGISAVNSAYQQFNGLYALLAILWALAALIVCMKAATLMTSERSRQTLESLLACPLSAREIFEQKIAGTKRLTIVMAVPVLTVHLTLFLVQVNFSSLSTGLVLNLIYPLLTVMNTFLFLSLVTWMSAGIGLAFHSQIKAVLTATLAVSIWIAGPLLLSFLSFLFWSDSIEAIRLLSPVSAVAANEVGLQQIGMVSPGSWFQDYEINPTVLAILLTLGQTLLWIGLRSVILGWLPGLLGRRENDVVTGAAAQRPPLEGVGS